MTVSAPVHPQHPPRTPMRIAAPNLDHIRHTDSPRITVFYDGVKYDIREVLYTLPNVLDSKKVSTPFDEPLYLLERPGSREAHLYNWTAVDKMFATGQLQHEIQPLRLSCDLKREAPAINGQGNVFVIAHNQWNGAILDLFSQAARSVGLDYIEYSHLLLLQYNEYSLVRKHNHKSMCHRSKNLSGSINHVIEFGNYEGGDFYCEDPNSTMKSKKMFWKQQHHRGPSSLSLFEDLGFGGGYEFTYLEFDPEDDHGVTEVTGGKRFSLIAYSMESQKNNLKKIN